MRFLENIVQSISARVLPTACIVCDQFQSDWICPGCLQSVYDSSFIHYECCYQCAIPLGADELTDQQCKRCKADPPFFNATYCLSAYDGPLQSALHQLKYQKRIAFAHGLADAWNRILSRKLEHSLAACLLPVPLSIEKLMARGFNQSWELAKRVHCDSHLQKLSQVLKRHHHAGHQAGSTITARREDIRGMFYIDDRYLDFLRGRVVIVFDDVMTTGATLNEIARILKAAGVRHIINWVLLRTTRLG